jgi:regulator of replication initiation timing
MKLNREQIIKVLEHCSNWTAETGCKGCPYDENCIDKDVMKDALALITTQDQRIKELTEEYESMAKSVNEASELIRKLRTEKKKLTEENARLRAENERFKSLSIIVKVPDEEETKKIIEADTVRKMQEALEQRIHSKLSYHGWYLKETVIAEIAKEMLEDKQ